MNVAILACVEQHVLHQVKSRRSSFSLAPTLAPLFLRCGSSSKYRWKPSVGNEQSLTFQKLKFRVFGTNLDDVYSYLTATLQYYISFGITAAHSSSPPHPPLFPASFPFYSEVHTNS